MTEREIIVRGVWPPVPTRSFDYCAIYDGDEPDDECNMKAGYGKTPEAAIQDLRDNFPDEEPDR
jgi:hypothetical protein